MESPIEIILVSPVTQRFKYIARFIFSTCLGLKYRIFSPTDEILLPGKWVLNYNSGTIEGAVNIYSAGLLEETGIHHKPPDAVRNRMQYFLFPAPDGYDLPFDIFSAAFYMITRYEEYQSFTPDMYGRFEADQSLAYRHGFCEDPVVDQWIVLLKQLLKKKFPGITIPDRKFSFVSTIDIDSPWAYRHKGWLRTSLSMLKSMATFNLEEMVMRMDVLGGKTGDPFDTFEYIRDIETKHRFCSLFFFLSGNKGRYDVNYSLHTEQFKTLIHQMKQDRTLGIHPSYRSNHNRKDRAREFDRFASLLGNQPVISRQHYLFLRFPSTYMQLIESGIREDYSMGYASYPGFRAGTCTPFRFYDLLRETETSLVVHPFPVMDVTLRKYLQLTPNEAIDRILILADRVREVNGRFVSLWHNESLSEYGMWKGWRRVFEEMAGKLTTDPGVQA